MPDPAKEHHATIHTPDRMGVREMRGDGDRFRFAETGKPGS
jgi:hypothetical protein